ncbi:LysR substrate-binding domain-containing protein [Arhodomonas aquaeolei]|uniref:LysR family transcriptional regulator n=1 Tax=Arhodomonas aquaeolei TaxID=2369 RepID=UPI002166DDD6|nr:LysR substrate-binding domain-containing protein [Arhodomonas aquaeolei]MCS4504235.1 LysR substrate-binding domain-containing protein [Arhodomonas aquaeolei]
MTINLTHDRTLDIDLLRTFHLACALGTLRAVAERRHFTLGAVSQQIKRLEHQLGRTLLVRSRSGVSLTAEGARLRAQSATLLDEHDTLIHRLIDRPAAGVVRLGLPEEYVPALLGSVLPDLARSHPDLHLHVRTDTSGTLRHLVDTGTLDLALVVVPEAQAPSRHRLWRTRPVWAMAAGEREAIPALVPLALHPAECPYRAIALTALEAAGRDWETVFSSASVTAVESAVAAGLAISVLDRARVENGHSGMREAGPGEGLPALPACFACLVEGPPGLGTNAAAVQTVGERIQAAAVTGAPPNAALPAGTGG